MASGLPQRKEKTALTLIPEEERAISYRFNIALVGVKAKEFAEYACESEMAQAYKPKKANKVDKMDAIGEDEGDGEEKDGGKQRATSPVVQDEKKKHDEGNDALVLFCPIGGDPKSRDVARLRFQAIESFSDSLPVQSNDQVGVALLHWQIDNLDGTQKRITDYISRMAEIRHMQAEKRPYTVVLAFEAKQDQEQELNAFVDRQSKFDIPLSVIKSYHEDDGEDTIFDALQVVVDGMIEYAKNPPKSGEKPADSKPKSSRACAIL